MDSWAQGNTHTWPLDKDQREFICKVQMQREQTANAAATPVQHPGQHAHPLGPLGHSVQVNQCIDLQTDMQVYNNTGITSKTIQELGFLSLHSFPCLLSLPRLPATTPPHLSQINESTGACASDGNQCLHHPTHFLVPSSLPRPLQYCHPPYPATDPA